MILAINGGLSFSLFRLYLFHVYTVEEVRALIIAQLISRS